jgi:hypothetical protein
MTYYFQPPIKPGGRYHLVAKDTAPKSDWRLCPGSYVTAVVYNLNATQDGPTYKLVNCYEVDLRFISLSSA